MKNANMTAGEIETLRTILRVGGRVVVSMGRKRGPECVRTSTINSLRAKGLIRLWSGPSTSLINVSGAEWDYAVTAKGCTTLAEVFVQSGPQRHVGRGHDRGSSRHNRELPEDRGREARARRTIAAYGRAHAGRVGRVVRPHDRRDQRLTHGC